MICLKQYILGIGLLLK